MTTTKTRAIVAHEPNPGPNWRLQDILVPDTLKDGEFLIDMVATGICHTDLLVTGAPAAHVKYPLVAGHEGAGYIKAIGPNVTKKHLSVGDPVLLSFWSCMECHSCKVGCPNNCPAFMKQLAGLDDAAFRSADGKVDINGSFFGQSSFSSLSVVKETCILSAKSLINDPEELKLFSPLGCGLQTGAGSVLNVAKPRKTNSVMVAGLGGVGLAAIMAAKIAGCHEIIGVDILASRLDGCKDFGATKALNTKDVADLTATLREAANDGRGPDIVIDTTGVDAVRKAGYDCLANGGTLILVGASPNPVQEMTFNIREVMTRCIKIVGCMEGDSNPEEFIPELVKYYREGRFPIDKMTKYYKADDFQKALHDMHTGETIKAVLEW